MLTSRTSRWSAVTGLICVVLLAASWFLLVSPRRSHAADLESQAAAAQSQATTLQTEISQLKAQYADLPARRKALAAITAQLPAQADVPTLVRTLQTYAASSGVQLTGVTPGAPTVVTADGTTSSASTAPIGSVVSIPVSVAVTGDYFEATLFTKQLQTSLPRAFLITGLTTAAAQAGSGITLTLQGQIFVLVTASTVPTTAATHAASGSAGSGGTSGSSTSTSTGTVGGGTSTPGSTVSTQ